MTRLQAIFDELPTPPGESVWTYPAVPRIDPCHRELRVCHSGRVIARTTRGVRVLETGHPPIYYFPMDDVRTEHLVLAHGQSWSAHLGPTRFFDVRVGRRRSPLAAWIHPRPAATHAALKGYVAFHAGRVDGACVDDEPAIPQPGGDFGGWITSDVVGPYLGGRGDAQSPERLTAG